MAVVHTLLCLAAFVCLSASLKSCDVPRRDPWRHVSADLDHQWMTFKKAYNRTYSDGVEEIRRRLYWEDTTRMIENHNAAYSRGDTSFHLAENHFADMAEDEFAGLYMRGLRPPADDNDYPPALTESDLGFPPTVMDWRREGLVTPVKDQGRCGSCWAFSAVGALEAKHKKKTGQLISLSAQDLIDCDRGHDDFGCAGGWTNNAYQYIEDSGGVDSEECYPYRGENNNCQFRRNCVTATVSGYKKVGRSEHSLQFAVAWVGPISVAVDMTNRVVWSYKGGILDVPTCKKWTVSHSMLVVGYGEHRGIPYWIGKNSWGTNWGDGGYVYMSRNKNNQCGIANFASYPV